MTPTERDWDEAFEEASSSHFSPTPYVSGPPKCSYVEVDIDSPVSKGTRPKSRSKLFEELQKDAEKYNTKPIEMNLPRDLSPVQAAVMADYAVVAGVYVTLDGTERVYSQGVPYSQRWRTEVLGLSKATIQRALVQLVRRGLLRECGQTPQRGYSLETKLYAPGPAMQAAESPAETPDPDRSDPS
jgi:hypothetical protein